MLSNFIFGVINYFKISFSPEHFWDAASAIANTAMVVTTFLLLKSTVKSEKDRNRRELVGEVISPLLDNLDSVEIGLYSSTVNRGSPNLYFRWKWREIKLNKYSLIYLLDKKVLKEIEEYDQHLIKFEYFFTQQIDVFAAVIREDFKVNVLPRLNFTFAEEYKTDGFLENFPYGAECRIKIGGKLWIIGLLRVVFLNNTFKEYIKSLEQDTTIQNTEISYMEYMVSGARKGEINEDVINDISIRMKDKVMADPKLKEFILKYEDIIKETEALRATLLKL